MRRGLQTALGAATVAVAGTGSIIAVRLSGGTPEARSLAVGWALATVNALAAWSLNRWVMAGAVDLFVRRVSMAIAFRVPLLIIGLTALAMLTDLQARSLLVAFFGGYLSAMVWEIALLHRISKRV